MTNRGFQSTGTNHATSANNPDATVSPKPIFARSAASLGSSFRFSDTTNHTMPNDSERASGIRNQYTLKH